MNNSATVHLHGQFHYMVLHLLSQDTLLHLVSMLKQLLDDIVAENVCHELKSVRLNFTENLLLLITIRSLKLLLDET